MNKRLLRSGRKYYGQIDFSSIHFLSKREASCWEVGNRQTYEVMGFLIRLRNVTIVG
jgi:hypothetical protein